MNLIHASIVLPLVAGVVSLFIPRSIRHARAVFPISVCAMSTPIAGVLIARAPLLWSAGGRPFLVVDGLSALIAVCMAGSATVVAVYAAGFFAGRTVPSGYDPLYLITLGVAHGAVFANDLIVLVICWGFLGLTMYMMFNAGDEESARVAKKSMIIVGGSDSLMILGIALIVSRTGTVFMTHLAIPTNDWLTITAYLLMAAAACAKAGAVPLHTWIPDAAQHAPLPAVAYLPSSLDKLLGIYLFVRCTRDLFVLTAGVQTLVMALGALTLIIAVMMALIQHDLKRLLGYHAVSQVGYMILGIATLNPIGIAGGLFHLVNNVIYKTALFMSGGAVERQADTTDLDRLGGLAIMMPVSFAVTLIASLAIAGIPPLNGFFSKWMVYQGIIEAGMGGGGMWWTVWLLVALFGSGLTLASFLKLLHAVYLGRDAGLGRIKEAPALMLVPMIVLAGLCLALGAGAYWFCVQFIAPAAGGTIVFAGVWESGLAFGMIVLGILAGFGLYLFGNLRAVRRDTSYIGGEELPIESRITGTDFYTSIQELPVIRTLYSLAQRRVFDIYDQGKRLLVACGRGLQWFHAGIIQEYVAWTLVGVLAVFAYLCIGAQ